MEFINFFSNSVILSESITLRLIIASLFYAIIFIFQAIALYTIGKREGYKHRWMAFVPVLNTFYLGVCSQKNKVFNTSTKKYATFVAIAELVTILSFALYFVCESLLVNYLEGAVYEYVFPTLSDFYPVKTLQSYTGYSADLPTNLYWATYVFEYGGQIASVFQLVYEIMAIFLVMSFFKTYSPRNHFLFTILCIFFFPAKAIFAFAVRNNKGKNYMDYIRAEQERQYRMRQQYYQQFYQNNPYSDQGVNSGSYGNSSGESPYNTAQNPFNNGQNPTPAPEDPFGDYSSNSGANNRSNGNSNNNNTNSQSAPPPKDPFDDF